MKKNESNIMIFIILLIVVLLGFFIYFKTYNVESFVDNATQTQADLSQYYQELTKDGIWYKQNLDSGNETIKNIIHAINENLSELDYIQTKLNTVNNLNQEALLKKGELIKLQNDDLQRQLKELEHIQSNIRNKDRLIEQTNYTIKREELSIRILIISCILAFLLVITIVLYGYYQISFKTFIVILSIIILLYIILFVYNYNIFYFRDSISYIGNIQRIDLELGKELKNWGKIASTNVKNEVNYEKARLKKLWIKNNCECTPEEEQSQRNIITEETRIDAIGDNQYAKERAGHFYYDGSAPQQLIIPTPNPKKLDEKIDWVDYSPNGRMIYNEKLNKNQYINNNYYNYKSKHKLLNEIHNRNPLVNNQTYTTNI